MLLEYRAYRGNIDEPSSIAYTSTRVMPAIERPAASNTTPNGFEMSQQSRSSGIRHQRRRPFLRPIRAVWLDFFFIQLKFARIEITHA